MKKVWLIYNGEYEDRDVIGVAASLTDAVVFIKNHYPAPYVVTWEGPSQSADNEWSLSGQFESVPRFSVRHTDRFDIIEWNVEGN